MKTTEEIIVDIALEYAVCCRNWRGKQKQCCGRNELGKQKEMLHRALITACNKFMMEKDDETG